jgi:hypothetical protein
MTTIDDIAHTREDIYDMDIQDVIANAESAHDSKERATADAAPDQRRDNSCQTVHTRGVTTIDDIEHHGI